MNMSCQCGMKFRSMNAEARHRHNFPALCRRPKISVKMSECIAYARKNGGKLHRAPGGFWKKKGDLSNYWAHSFGTPTIEALVKRGFMEYTAWQAHHHPSSKGEKFPIEATLTEVKEAS